MLGSIVLRNFTLEVASKSTLVLKRGEPCVVFSPSLGEGLGGTYMLIGDGVTAVKDLSIMYANSLSAPSTPSTVGSFGSSFNESFK